LSGASFSSTTQVIPKILIKKKKTLSQKRRKEKQGMDEKIKVQVVVLGDFNYMPL